MCDIALMNGLEDASIYHELMFRVPDALSWALIDELDEGLEISVPAHVIENAVLPSSTWKSSNISALAEPSPLEGSNRFVSIGIITPERLRLGVSRLLSSLIESDSDLRFTLLGSLHEELPDAVIDCIVQAAMLGVLLPPSHPQV